MTTVETAWRPVAPEGVQIGPAVWNGTSLVVEAAAHRGGRIYTLGAAEALVLEALREPGTVDEIADRVKESSGLAISLRSVERIINIFLVHGLVVRPTGTVPQEAQDIDPASQEQASSQHPSPASPPRALQVITSCAWGVAGTRIAPVLALLCIAVGAMVAAGVVSGWSQNNGLRQGADRSRASWGHTECHRRRHLAPGIAVRARDRPRNSFCPSRRRAAPSPLSHLPWSGADALDPP